MLTAYEQAKKYDNDLPLSEKARYIITCNFRQFYIYDMNKSHPNPIIVELANLPDELYRLEILVGSKNMAERKEEELSIKAGELVGKLYNALIKQYSHPDSAESLHSLNVLCVRLVFCLYAEDSGIFKKNMFHDYLLNIPANKIRTTLIELFDILHTPTNERDEYIEDELNAFPYVNGGLFDNGKAKIEIPLITEEIKDILLKEASEGFNWSEISPTIFGAVFESTLNSETRHRGGMHFTPVKNIHKVIDPLFLDDLNAEYRKIVDKKQVNERIKALKAFQNKLAGLTFLDPACGSGNFLTETFLSLRRLENKVFAELYGEGLIVFEGTEEVAPIKVSINQFYGVEIHDFAVTVARTALWIAEHQMMKETDKIIHSDITDKDFLPLKTNAYIKEGNALCIDWETIVPKEKLTYIMGNPPFLGARNEDFSDAMKAELASVFDNINGCGNLDYVCGWYKKAADYMAGTSIRAALVSTNSITQGEQVPILWNKLNQEGIHIDFAYRTFRWDSESNGMAHVHCVIIGFSRAENDKPKKIFELDNVIDAKNINGYLIDAANIYPDSRSVPISNVPHMSTGSMPNDCRGKLSKIPEEEMHQIIKDYPYSKSLFRRFLGADEFIKGKTRWCLWLVDVSPKIIQGIPPINKRVQEVFESRSKSSRKETRDLASTPMLFGEIRQPNTDYVLIPRHSGENRAYIPMGYVTSDIICGDSTVYVPNASLYHFGVLTSIVHMAWTGAVCGRIKSDYRYSVDIVYNNFPWCTPTQNQIKKIEQTAQAILDARSKYTDCNLEDMYGKDMYLYDELCKAHKANDKAVMAAYGFNKDMSESEIVSKLMKMYQDKI